MTSPIQHPSSVSSSRLIWSLILLFCGHVIIHAPFLMTEYFGEPDAARMTNDIIRASYSGVFHELEYLFDSCPLYYNVLLVLLKSGVISIANLSMWLTMSSLLAGAMVSVAMFGFVYRLTASWWAAWAAALVLQLIPPFWFNNLYGFPTMVALAFFMSSLVLLQSAVVQGGRSKGILLVGAGILYVLAVMTKVDLLLASAIFCLPVWQSGRSLKEKIMWVGSLAVFSGFTFLVHHQVVEFMNSYQKISWDYAEWSDRYSLLFHEFVSRRNLWLTAKSVGILTIPGALFGGLLVMWRREWRSTVIWLALAILPLLLFWGMRPQNSSRHILIPSLFLCILLALPLVMRAWKRWTWAAFLCAMCVVNYFTFPATADYLWSPSGRIVASTYLMEDKVKGLHALGSMIAHLPQDKIAVIGQGPLHPYFKSEVLRREQLSYVNYVHSKHTDEKRVEILEMKEDNRAKWFRYIRYKPDMSEIHVLAGEGFFLVVLNKELANELGDLPDMRGKWMVSRSIL